MWWTLPRNYFKDIKSMKTIKSSWATKSFLLPPFASAAYTCPFHACGNTFPACVYVCTNVCACVCGCVLCHCQIVAVVVVVAVRVVELGRWTIKKDYKYKYYIRLLSSRNANWTYVNMFSYSYLCVAVCTYVCIYVEISICNAFETYNYLPLELVHGIMTCRCGMELQRGCKN